MEETQIMSANFKIDKSVWVEFQYLCRKDDSDASKELRKFIDQYLNNSQ